MKWDKELCRTFAKLSTNRKSIVYYANKYKRFARTERLMMEGNRQ